MKDGRTKSITEKMNDWGLDKIYEMEDNLYSLEENVAEIVEYLKDIHFSMPLGLALRRYICECFSSELDLDEHCYIFRLDDGKVIKTKDYMSDEEYDIEQDDIPEYIELFNYINRKYNTDENGVLTLEIPKAEVRRQLRATSSCVRKKMFLLSFALHMDEQYTAKFLTDVLSEQTYNYREPHEIIAYFCQSNEAYNHYQTYEQLCHEYDEKAKTVTPTASKKENYTSFARTAVTEEIKTKEELFDFLLANVANFHTYSETAYKEFLALYKKAGDKLLKHDGGADNGVVQPETVREWIENRKHSVPDDRLIYPEQLAKEMLACIPRATFEKNKDGKKIISNDFISIHNGESGQNSKKVKTTELPKNITMNLPVSDRLWDLLKREKPVERKDLVFMKFYVFSLDLEEKEDYSSEDYFVFLEECNALLVRCGMSRLYPGNRFENLIMLSLLASNPFEMFENIIEYSFINEPTPLPEE